MEVNIVRARHLSTVCSFALAFVVSACAGGSPGAPPEYQADVDRLTRVFAAFDSVSTLVTVPDGQVTMRTTPTHTNAVYAQLELGLATGDSISDEFLDWMHSEMRDAFRRNLLGGNRAYLEGLREDNVGRQIEGIERIKAWHSDFWDRYGEALADRALGT